MEIRAIFENIFNWEYTEYEFIAMAEELLSGHVSKYEALIEDLRHFEIEKRNEIIGKIEPEKLKSTLLNIKPFPLKSPEHGDKWILKKWESDKSFIEYYSPPKKVPKTLVFLTFCLSQDWIMHIKKEIEVNHFPFELMPIYKFQAIIEKLVTHSKSDFNSKKLSLPDCKKVAEQYHKERGSKHKQYNAEQIAPVMEVTKTYIEENHGIHTIHGHVKPIRQNCKDLAGGRDAKSNWINFYAEKAGLETK